MRIQQAGFNAVFVVFFIIFIAIFAFVIAMMFSPRLRGKMMARQVKSVKYMVNESKEDIKDINTGVADIAVDSARQILDEHKEDIVDIATDAGDISVKTINNILEKNSEELGKTLDKAAKAASPAITKTVGAVKEGISSTGRDRIFCKHCGAAIDSDSKFCKECGKEQ